ncbi:UNVERIFIED_CONTAM: hypothetical protein K2H54_003538 [Gekko kuhli]
MKHSNLIGQPSFSILTRSTDSGAILKMKARWPMTPFVFQSMNLPFSGKTFTTAEFGSYTNERDSLLLASNCFDETSGFGKVVKNSSLLSSLVLFESAVHHRLFVVGHLTPS